MAKEEMNNIVGNKLCTTYADLQEKYPRMFLECRFNLRDGHGWIPEIDKMCSLLQRRHDQNQHMGYTQVKAVQVKQKFGGLRFYWQADAQVHPSEYTKWSNWHNWIDGVVDMTETFCRYVCETCGEQGKMRNTEGYYYTSCDLHIKIPR